MAGKTWQAKTIIHSLLSTDLGKPPTLSGSLSQERFSIFFVLARFQYSTAGFKKIPRLAFKNEEESKLLFSSDLTSSSHNFFLTL